MKIGDKFDAAYRKMRNGKMEQRAMKREDKASGTCKECGCKGPCKCTKRK
jgi:hypothetical protein